jgi:hypothetical protein
MDLPPEMDWAGMPADAKDSDGGDEKMKRPFQMDGKGGACIEAKGGRVGRIRFTTHDNQGKGICDRIVGFSKG